MNMKITKKICRAVGIINAWDYASRFPYLSYTPQETGRYGWTHFSGWRITKAGVMLSDDYRDGGSMSFSVYHRDDKQPQFNAAAKWMEEKFHIVELVKTPMGSWMGENFVKERNKEILYAYKSGISLGTNK